MHLLLQKCGMLQAELCLILLGIPSHPPMTFRLTIATQGDAFCDLLQWLVFIIDWAGLGVNMETHHMCL